MIKTPVILDTDIGTDIDDFWALVLLLQSPELDIKLITSATGDTIYRARIIAKVLDIAGRTDIPIAIGEPESDPIIPMESWLGKYDLYDYKGEIYKSAPQAIVDCITNSPDKITLISICPLNNIAASLKLNPSIVNNSRFIGMHGSIRVGYEGRPGKSRDYNIKHSIADAQYVFSSNWNITITPMDTCVFVNLKDEKYKKVYNSQIRTVQSLIESYKSWIHYQNFLDKNRINPEIHSTILYDTVAVYLAISQELLNIEQLPLQVTDDGYVEVNNTGRLVNCATSWKSLSDFEDFLVDRYTENTSSIKPLKYHKNHVLVSERFDHEKN